MRGNFRIVSVALSALTLLGTVGFSAVAIADGKKAENTGKQIAFNKKKGNCLACHVISGGAQPGNIAPPLGNMKARFPKKADLRAQISDPQAKNPDTVMPPFSKHGILTDKEIDAVVDFIYSL